MDHVAIAVHEIQSALDWYSRNFQCEVLYQDESWALLQFANIKLALVVPSQHPAHLGFFRPDAGDFGALTPHRDGTKSIYINDPAGNSVELLTSE
jgi:catechol 2,3-dioxygenase-like lactoylglutathione lyase family enzyme